MRQMTTEKLFDDGKYMVIYLYPESVKFDERMFFLWTKQDHEQVVNLYDFISFKNIFKIISKFFFLSYNLLITSYCQLPRWRLEPMTGVTIPMHLVHSATATGL